METIEQILREPDQERRVEKLLVRVNHRLDHIERLIDRRFQDMADALGGIQADVTAEGGLVDQVVTELQAVSQQLAEKASQPTVDPAEIATIQSNMDAQIQRLTAAVTPAGPSGATGAEEGATGAEEGASGASGP